MKKQKVEKIVMESFIIPFDIELDWFIEQCKKAKNKGAEKLFIYQNKFKVHFIGYRDETDKELGKREKNVKERWILKLKEDKYIEEKERKELKRLKEKYE